MNATATPTRITAPAIRALLALAHPSARLLVVSGECYLIHKAVPKSMSAKTYDALYYAGWIDHPRDIGAAIAECTLTDEGRAAAAQIRAEMCKYCQLALFEEGGEHA